jgi:GNAT superfamily N-acetyltransferase
MFQFEPNEADIPAEIDSMNGATAEPSVILVDARRRASVRVPEGNLLLAADFARFGPDLYLLGAHDVRILLSRYFARKKPPDLVTEHGAVLPPDLVAILAGPAAPGVYPRQPPESARDPFGFVESLNGDVLIRRANGLPVQASLRDIIFPGDVVTTGRDGTLALRYPTGLSMTLAADGRLGIGAAASEKTRTGGKPVMWLVRGILDFAAVGTKTEVSRMTVGTPSAIVDLEGVGGRLCVDPNGATSLDAPDRPAALVSDAEPADADITNDNENTPVSTPATKGFKKVPEPRAKKGVALVEHLKVWNDQVNERFTPQAPSRKFRTIRLRPRPASAPKLLRPAVIRHGTKKDEVACAIVMSQTHAIKDLMAGRSGSANGSLATVHPRGRGDMKRLVAAVNGTAVGFIDFDADDSRIKYLFVDHAFQGKGIGTSLLRAAERAMSAGADLFVLTTKDRVVLWYLRRGYQVDTENHEEGVLCGRAVWTHLRKRVHQKTPNWE